MRDTKGEGGGGGETTKEQPTAKRETQTRRERTKSRAAGGREKQTKHSAKATRNGKGSERGATPAWRGPSKAERHSSQRKRWGAPQRAREAGPARPGHKEQAHARQPPSGWMSARPEGTQPLPATNSRRPDGRVRARWVRSPCRLPTAAFRMDVCAPGGYPAPASYDSRRPDGRVSDAPHSNTTHRADTPMNRSQEAQDTAHAKQHTERAHR